MEDRHQTLLPKRQNLVLDVPNKTIKVVKKASRLFYGTKKTRDMRKAKKRCVDGCDMYIVRVKKDSDEWAMSRPCRDCWEVMETLGIKRAYYTTGDGTWMCEKVADMEITYRSSGVLALRAYREEERAQKK